MDDDVFINTVNEVIEIGVKAHDIEVIDCCYSYLIKYYQEHRSYKKSLESALRARDIRRYGCLHYK